MNVVTTPWIPALQHTPVNALHGQNQLQLYADQIAVEQQIPEQLGHQLRLQRNPVPHTTRRPLTGTPVPAAALLPATHQASRRHQSNHTPGGNQTPQPEPQHLHLGNRSQGCRDQGEMTGFVRVSISCGINTPRQRIQPSQGRPLPTASRMLRNPWRSSCSCKPSRILGTRSGPWKIQPV